jgi:hypothetical protein
MVIYYIYEIPGKKIGVTKNPINRVSKQQNVSKWNILEQHTCIKTVSDREIELQKQYGYPVDTRLYWQVMEWQSKSHTNISYSNNKMTQCHTPEARKKAHTPEARKKAIANTNWENRNKKIDWETRTKKLKKEVLVFKNGNFIAEFDSVTEAGKSLNVDYSQISQCCNGKYKSAKGYTFKYKESKGA